MSSQVTITIEDDFTLLRAENNRLRCVLYPTILEYYAIPKLYSYSNNSL